MTSTTGGRPLPLLFGGGTTRLSFSQNTDDFGGLFLFLLVGRSVPVVDKVSEETNSSDCNPKEVTSNIVEDDTGTVFDSIGATVAGAIRDIITDCLMFPVNRLLKFMSDYDAVELFLVMWL